MKGRAYQGHFGWDSHVPPQLESTFNCFLRERKPMYPRKSPLSDKRGIILDIRNTKEGLNFYT